MFVGEKYEGTNDKNLNMRGAKGESSTTAKEREQKARVGQREDISIFAQQTGERERKRR